MHHIMTKTVVLALALALTGITIAGSEREASAWGDVDCADFATHEDAQSFFIQNGGPWSDPYWLDADDDGIACELLPSYSW